MVHFSPLGIVIIVVFYAISIGLLLLLARLLSGWRGRWLILIPLAFVAIALPWADEIYITHRFAKLCEGAGVHVARKVEVEGFYDDTMPSAYELIRKYGYRFIEHRLDDGTIERVERVDGNWKATRLSKPTARYHYKYADPDERVLVGLKLYKRETIVLDVETGEIIGRDVHFYRYPGWVESLWVRYFGTGQTICEGTAPQPPKVRHLLYHYVLIPTNKTN